MRQEPLVRYSCPVSMLLSCLVGGAFKGSRRGLDVGGLSKHSSTAKLNATETSALSNTLMQTPRPPEAGDESLRCVCGDVCEWGSQGAHGMGGVLLVGIETHGLVCGSSLWVSMWSLRVSVWG